MNALFKLWDFLCWTSWLSEIGAQKPRCASHGKVMHIRNSMPVLMLLCYQDCKLTRTGKLWKDWPRIAIKCWHSLSLDTHTYCVMLSHSGTKLWSQWVRSLAITTLCGPWRTEKTSDSKKNDRSANIFVSVQHVMEEHHGLPSGRCHWIPFSYATKSNSILQSSSSQLRR